MKKLLMIFFAGMLSVVFLSCQKTPDPPENSHASNQDQGCNDTTRLDISKMSPKAKEQIKSKKISLDVMIELISILMDEPSLFNIAKHKSLGGVFEADAFRPKPGKAGARLWYCYNPQYRRNQLPEFFFALDHATDITKPAELLASDKEFIVGDTFLYKKRDYEEATLRNYITGHTKTTTSPVKTINQEQVREFSENFASLMDFLSPTPYRLYSKYAVAVFEYDAAYNSFMSPNPQWIRCYLGMAQDPDHRPNYVRPILGRAGAGGVTMLKLDSDDDPFLQKSVPPPPY